MADPLSIIASVTAVLTFSIQACRYIGEFVSQVHGAPTEIRQYQLCLQALTATFYELLKLCNVNNLANDLKLPPEFNSRLISCKDDIEGMRMRIDRIAGSLDNGKVVKTWARMKFALFNDRQLEKFFGRVQIYQATFTLDLIAFNTRISVHNAKLLSNLSSQSRHSFEGQEILRVTVQQPTTIEASQTSALKCWYRARFWHTLRLGSCTIIVSTGQTQTIHGFGKARPTSPISLFAGLRFQLQLRLGAWRKSLSGVLFFEECALYSGSSLRCVFSQIQVLPRSAEIFHYARQGELSVVRSMFMIGRASPIDTTQDGLGLLHIACNYKHLKLTQFLLEAGADVHATDDDGRTPLHWAISNSDDFELCRILLRHGADMGSQDMEAKTPLHTFYNPVIGKVLLEHQDLISNLDADHNGMTILQFAARSSLSTVEHLEHFLKNQPYLSMAPDSDGRILLHFASERGNLALMRYLCSVPFGAGINLVDNARRAPIHYATRSKRVAAIDLLVAQGADLNSISAQGWTILHEAASRDSIAAVKHVIRLLGTSAEVMLTTIDKSGLTPLDVARKWNAFRVSTYLETHHKPKSHQSSSKEIEKHHTQYKHVSKACLSHILLGIRCLLEILAFSLRMYHLDRLVDLRLHK